MTLRPSPADAGQRLDHYLQRELPQYSRSRLQSWVKEGLVRVDGIAARASLVLRGTEAIEVSPGELPPLHATPEDIPLDVLYEDDAVVAVNKPAGMVVHAGGGVHEGTLTNALVHRFAALSQLGGDLRPGIVHRLDRETSGVILVAKSDSAHRALAEQFASRTVEKIYLTLVHGSVRDDNGRITLPIARDPVRRTRMTTRLPEGREALTDWHVLRRFARLTHLRVRIGTGRTHQIRVHLSALGHPVVGDRMYGAPPEVASLGRMERVFLHAHEITFTSPATSAPVTVSVPLPPELQSILDALQ